MRASEMAEAKRAGEKITTKETISVPISVSSETKKTLATNISNTAKSFSKKGVVQHLLVDSFTAVQAGVEAESLSKPPKTDGEEEEAHQQPEKSGPTNVGPELVTELLRFGRACSSMVVTAFDKLTLQDFIGAAQHPQGTHVVQQLVISMSQPAPSATGEAASSGKQQAATSASTAQRPVEKISVNNLGKKRGRDGQPVPPTTPRGGALQAATAAPPAPSPSSAAADLGPLTRLYRRLEQHLYDLAVNRYSSFVVEKLYDYGSMALKEALLTVLKQRHYDLKNDFVGGKLISKINLEQFMFRTEEWRKMSERQTSVKRLMQQILNAEAIVQ